MDEQRKIIEQSIILCRRLVDFTSIACNDSRTATIGLIMAAIRAGLALGMSEQQLLDTMRKAIPQAVDELRQLQPPVVD